MTYSYVTHSQQNAYYTIVFADSMDSDTTVSIRFLPTVSMPFAPGHLDLYSIKHRDLAMILYNLELYGMTLITNPRKDIFTDD